MNDNKLFEGLKTMIEGSEKMFKGMSIVFEGLCCQKIGEGKALEETAKVEEPISVEESTATEVKVNTEEPVTSDAVIALARKKMEQNKSLQEVIGKMVSEAGVQSISDMTQEQLKSLKVRIEQL